ncbi:hypothetical protein DPMN_122108 [Dreissena polymorpha]|uniref:Uncharacterized protein n=1 Tax=Dreissena polymorpha TaxID=45954 RepID=A0A9D4GP14_DREPO|nr:hypothetical protein DPMN_122108 [Dreissena polymorpha]
MDQVDAKSIRLDGGANKLNGFLRAIEELKTKTDKCCIGTTDPKGKKARNKSNRLNKGVKGNNVIDFEQLLRGRDRVKNRSSTIMVPSEPLQPSQPTMPTALNITTESTAMPTIRTFHDPRAFFEMLDQLFFFSIKGKGKAQKRASIPTKWRGEEREGQSTSKQDQEINTREEETKTC